MSSIKKSRLVLENKEQIVLSQRQTTVSSWNSIPSDTLAYICSLVTDSVTFHREFSQVNQDFQKASKRAFSWSRYIHQPHFYFSTWLGNQRHDYVGNTQFTWRDPEVYQSTQSWRKLVHAYTNVKPLQMYIDNSTSYDEHWSGRQREFFNALDYKNINVLSILAANIQRYDKLYTQISTGKCPILHKLHFVEFNPTVTQTLPSLSTHSPFFSSLSALQELKLDFTNTKRSLELSGAYSFPELRTLECKQMIFQNEEKKNTVQSKINLFDFSSMKKLTLLTFIRCTIRNAKIFKGLPTLEHLVYDGDTYMYDEIKINKHRRQLVDLFAYIQFKRLTLSRCPFQVEQTNAVFSALKIHASKLIRMDTESIAGMTLPEDCSFLEEFDQLEYLKLGANFTNVRSIRYPSASLKTLVLHPNVEVFDEIKEIYNAIFTPLSTCSQLENLQFLDLFATESNNTVNLSFLLPLQKLPRLQTCGFRHVAWSGDAQIDDIWLMDHLPIQLKHLFVNLGNIQPLFIVPHCKCKLDFLQIVFEYNVRDSTLKKLFQTLSQPAMTTSSIRCLEFKFDYFAYNTVNQSFDFLESWHHLQILHIDYQNNCEFIISQIIEHLPGHLEKFMAVDVTPFDNDRAYMGVDLFKTLIQKLNGQSNTTLKQWIVMDYHSHMDAPPSYSKISIESAQIQQLKALLPSCHELKWIRRHLHELNEKEFKNPSCTIDPDIDHVNELL